jgi:MFS family permease
MQVIGLFLIGFCDDYTDEDKFYYYLLIGRVLMGLGNGYIINLCFVSLNNKS